MWICNHTCCARTKTDVQEMCLEMLFFPSVLCNVIKFQEAVFIVRFLLYVISNGDYVETKITTTYFTHATILSKDTKALLSWSDAIHTSKFCMSLRPESVADLFLFLLIKEKIVFLKIHWKTYVCLSQAFIHVQLKDNGWICLVISFPIVDIISSYISHAFHVK